MSIRLLKRNKMLAKKAFFGLLSGLILCLSINGLKAEVLKDEIGYSLRLETLASIDRGASYLLQSQLGNGSWNNHPAITSLVTVALANAPERSAVDSGEAVDKALDYLKEQVHDDGALWNSSTEQYKLYSTAIGALALVRCNRPGDLETIGKIRNYLVRSQNTENSSDVKPVFFGGFAAGSGKRPTLTITQWVVEALYLIDSLRLPNDMTASSYRRGTKQEMYVKAVDFIKRCQVRNDDKNNTKTSDIGYFRDSPKKLNDAAENNTSQRMPRSKAFLTCLGIKSLRYAGYSKGKPELNKALAYLSENWNISKNPGLEMKGYYTYLYALSKALKSMNIPYIETTDGAKHHWRGDIIRELLSRQKGDGAWRQTTPAWWENNPSLVTAYAVLTLEQCLPQK